MNMTITGIITKALAEASGTSRVSGRPWRKRSYVLRYDGTNGQYPREVLFDVLGDKIDSLGLREGCEYEVEVDFGVREWNGKLFMTATTWKATAKDGPEAAPSPTPAPAPAPRSADDDLPF